MSHRYASFDIAKRELGNKWSVVLCTDIKRQEELILESCNCLIYSGLKKGLRVESIQEILKGMSRKALRSFNEILAIEKRKPESVKKQPKRNIEKYLERGV